MKKFLTLLVHGGDDSAARALSLALSTREALAGIDLVMLEESLPWRATVRQPQSTPSSPGTGTAEKGFPCASVCLTPEDVRKAAQQGAAFVYLPGEVCRQTDVLEAAAQAGKPVFLERGAFLAPDDVVRALDKLAGVEVTLIDAGSSFGYSDRVCDPRVLAYYKRRNLPFGLHVTHLTQGVPGPAYPWASTWVKQEDLLLDFVRLGASFGARALVLPAAFITPESLAGLAREFGQGEKTHV